MNTYHFTEDQLLKLLADFCEIYNEYDRYSGMPTKSRDAASMEMIEGLTAEKDFIKAHGPNTRNTSQIIMPEAAMKVIQKYVEMQK